MWRIYRDKFRIPPSVLQFSGKYGRILGWRTPLGVGVAPCEILDPPRNVLFWSAVNLNFTSTKKLNLSRLDFKKTCRTSFSCARFNWRNFSIYFLCTWWMEDPSRIAKLPVVQPWPERFVCSAQPNWFQFENNSAKRGTCTALNQIAVRIIFCRDWTCWRVRYFTKTENCLQMFHSLKRLFLLRSGQSSENDIEHRSVHYHATQRDDKKACLCRTVWTDLYGFVPITTIVLYLDTHTCTVYLKQLKHLRK